MARGKKQRRKLTPLQLFRKRSLAAKKGWRTRRLHQQGIRVQKTWETGAGEFERYRLESNDPKIIKRIINYVRGKTKKPARFTVYPQVDFINEDDKVFTNNGEASLDIDRTKQERIPKELDNLLLKPSSDPFTGKRDEVADVEGLFLVFRFFKSV